MNLRRSHSAAAIDSPTADAQVSPVRAPRRTQVVLWLVMFTIFVASPVMYVSDSKYSMLTAESLLRHGTPDLSHYRIPHTKLDLPFNTIEGRHAYQLQRTNGRLLYGFPHGTSVLSVPFVALLDLLDISASTPDNQFNLFGEVLLQKLIAAALMAAFVAIAFEMATLVLSSNWSLVIAIGAGLGTQVWSTASRGMWSHTWEITLGVTVTYLLLRSEAQKTSVRPATVATLLAWMYFVRPTGAVPVVFVAGYVFLYRREEFLAFLGTGIAWLLALIGYNIWIFGRIIPFYYTGQSWNPPGVPLAIYGSILSPSRGLFIYSPIFAMTCYWVVRYWRTLPLRRLALLSVLVIIGLLLSIAPHTDWWGGACYGPRLLTDALPWLLLLSTLALAAIPAEHRTLRNRSMAVAALALTLSIALNGLGALAWATERWNFAPQSPYAVLYWSRAQFLAPWMGY